MTAVDLTDRGQTEAVTFEFELPHPPAKVWRALTEPALLAEWLLPATNFSLAQGAAFTFNAPPQPGWDGAVNCRILEVDAPRLLRYGWVVGDIDTIVTFTVVPTPAGCRLRMVQSGFTPEQKRNFGGARYGWKMMGERLIIVLAKDY